MTVLLDLPPEVATFVTDADADTTAEAELARRAFTGQIKVP